MSIFKNWVQKASLTAKETVQKATQEDIQRTVDVIGDVAKVGVFLALTIMAARSGKHEHPIQQIRDIPYISVTNYYFGKMKEDEK